MNFIEELRWRGMLHQMTPDVEKLLSQEKVSGYCGFDPTASSMTIGNFVPIMLLMRFQRMGHKPFALVGGATGLIGDPSGKSVERQLMTVETIDANIASFKKQLSKYLDFDKGSNQAELVNNYDWFKDMNVFTFLRDIGKHLTVNYMMAKDSVQNRLENGISFTEFSYQLIQGYDFYWLWKNKNCKVQLAGSDQWGNMTAGMELIRRIDRGESHLITCPLVTKADGTKFGKTESGALWLDRNLTSPYQFYQYWLNASDADAGKYLRIFSFLDEPTIIEIETEHAKAPHLRLLQQTLGREVTTIVHSEADYKLALQTSEVLFGKATKATLAEIHPDSWREIFAGVPLFKVQRNAIESGIAILPLLTEACNIFPSKGEARKLIQAGGLKLNLEKVSDIDLTVNSTLLIQNKYLVLQKGKKDYYLLEVE